MTQALSGKKIAILVANGFEQNIMTQIQRRLIDAGANVRITSSESGLVNGWENNSWGHYFAVDVPLNEALAADFDMLIIPDGARSIDKMTLTAHSRRFIGGFMDASKPVVAMGAAVKILAFAERLSGYDVAVSEEYAAGLSDAGATTSQSGSIVDRNLMTIGASTESEVEALIPTVMDHLISADQPVSNAA